MFQPAQGEVEESQEPPSKKQKLTEVHWKLTLLAALASSKTITW